MHQINIYLIILSLFALSCTKEETLKKKTDYREKYIGDYRGIEVNQKNCYTGSYYHEDTVIIPVKFGSSDSTIIIYGSEVKLDKKGSFSYMHLHVSIANDSVSYSRWDGTPGCNFLVSFRGTKIK